MYIYTASPIRTFKDTERIIFIANGDGLYTYHGGNNERQGSELHCHGKERGASFETPTPADGKHQIFIIYCQVIQCVC